MIVSGTMALALLGAQEGGHALLLPSRLPLALMLTVGVTLALLCMFAVSLLQRLELVLLPLSASGVSRAAAAGRSCGGAGALSAAAAIYVHGFGSGGVGCSVAARSCGRAACTTS